LSRYNSNFTTTHCRHLLAELDMVEHAERHTIDIGLADKAKEAEREVKAAQREIARKAFATACNQWHERRKLGMPEPVALVVHPGLFFDMKALFPVVCRRFPSRRFNGIPVVIDRRIKEAWRFEYE
jgi:hypothetical protein